MGIANIVALNVKMDAVNPIFALSSNASLSGLVVNTATIAPTFASGTTSYTATVPIATTSITLTPTVAQGNATVRVNGVLAGSGAPR